MGDIPRMWRVNAEMNWWEIENNSRFSFCSFPLRADYHAVKMLVFLQYETRHCHDESKQMARKFLEGI